MVDTLHCSVVVVIRGTSIEGDIFERCHRCQKPTLGRERREPSFVATSGVKKRERKTSFIVNISKRTDVQHNGVEEERAIDQ